MPINSGYSQDLLLSKLLCLDNEGVESIADLDHDEEASPDHQQTKLGRGGCLHHHNNDLVVS